MQARLVNIGYGTIIAVDRIIAVVAPESAPIKRIVQEAKELKNLIDATYGRRTRSVIIMDNSTVVLSAVQPETITNRVNMDIIKDISHGIWILVRPIGKLYRTVSINIWI